MNTIIDIYNKTLSYNKNDIQYEMDKEGNIWFKFLNIVKILEYKSSKDTLRYKISIEHRKILKDIRNLHKNSNEQPHTIYINEEGLFSLLLKSRMKKAVEFQNWLISDALPKLRKYGKYEVDKKTKRKIHNLNHQIKILKHNLSKNKKYPKGYHVYIIKDDKKYKIGYTKNLNKRLDVYNTGRENKAEYAYYKETKCAKEIETCMKAKLSEYLYKSNKEFYDCNIKKIISVIKKCLYIEKKCKKCSDINKKILQTGGNQEDISFGKEIINYFINDIENKKMKLLNKYIFN
jgi:prophage antirepressor-like protein